MAKRHFSGIITSASLDEINPNHVPDLYANSNEGSFLYKKGHIESSDLSIKINVKIGGEVTKEQAEMVLTFILSKLEEIEFIEPSTTSP
jgi:hypothetical protein